MEAEAHEVDRAICLRLAVLNIDRDDAHRRATVFRLDPVGAQGLFQAALKPSGLIGPVLLRYASVTPLKP